MSLQNRCTDRSGEQSRPAYCLRIIAQTCFLVALAGPVPRSVWGGEVVQWSSKPSRNRVLEATGLPDRLGSDNVLWQVKRGRHHFAGPIIAGSKLLVGGDTAWLADERLRAVGRGRHGGLACLDLHTGQVLWELLTPPFVGDEQGVFGVCSTPVVEGDRIYVVGTRGNVLCLDLNGQADGNDGPFVDEAAYMSTGGREALSEVKATDGDIIWRYDILEHHPVLIHDAYAGTPLIQNELLWVTTCHSIGSEPVKHLLPSDTEKDKKLFERHHRANTPNLLVLNKQTGELVAMDNTVVKQVFQGQWSSPCMGIVDERPLVFWGDGYGVLHAYEPPDPDARTEDVQILKEVWWCDCNPREYRYDEEGKLRPYPTGAYRFRKGEFDGTHKEYLDEKNKGPCAIIGTPVFHQDRIYVAIGRDVNEGYGPGCVLCIDPRGTGDITDSGVVWASTDVGKSLLTPAVADGLLYIGDTYGMFHCFDAATGEKKWEHRVGHSIEYCSPLLADGRVYVVENGGRIAIFRHGAEKAVLFEDRARLHESSALTATDGILIVPAAQSITAYGKAGSAVAELKKLDQESSQGSENADGKVPTIGKTANDGIQTLENMKLNWPNLRGPGGYAHAHFVNAPTNWNNESGENILWKAEVPAHGFNSPIVWGKRVFVSGRDDQGFKVYCFDGDTGKMRWNKTLGKYPGSPAKLPKVSEDAGFAASTMATDGKRVFALFATGDLACYDFDGNRVWGKNVGVPDNSYGHASSLITDGQRLFVQYDQNEDCRVMTFDTATGDEVWRVTERDHPSWATPILIETEFGMQLIVLDGKFATSYDPATGKKLWLADCLGGEVAPSAAYNGAGIVVVANEYAEATALKLKAGGFDVLWRYDEYLPDISSPLASEEHLFIATSAAEVICLDILTGKALWEKEFDEPFSSSPILVGNRVYVLDQTGVMQIMEAGPEFKSVGSPTIGEPSFATPAYMDGRIYLRTDDHLYCIGEK